MGQSSELSAVPVRGHFRCERAPTRRGPVCQETLLYPALGPGGSEPQPPVLPRGFICISSSCHCLASGNPGLGALHVPQCLPSLWCLKTEYFFCLVPIEFMGPDIPPDHETESIILHLAFLFFCRQYKGERIAILYFKNPSFFWKTFWIFSKHILSPSKALSSTAFLPAHFPCLGHLTAPREGEASGLENAARSQEGSRSDL